MQQQGFFVPVLSTAPVTVVRQCQGGFGCVYVVTTENGERYAIKKLRNDDTANQNELREEALKIARLPPHPNVIKIISVVEIEGSPAIVLQYYPRSLRDVLVDGSSRETKMQLLLGIACGLKFLHETGGLLHGDLKPENVLISHGGEAVLSDFGLAKYLPKPQPTGLLQDLFVSGAVGTVAYMSPEQFITGKATQMSDIFALGIITFEMLTGTHPFLRASYGETVRSILYDSPKITRISTSSPPQIERVCLRCLAKNPAHRPTAAEVFSELRDTRSTRDETRPFDLVANVNRATTLSELGEVEKAQSLLQLCIDQEPWNLVARINLAGCLLRQQKIDQAIGVAKDALAIALGAGSGQQAWELCS
jgi:serine/threonine protein kinase